jgi:hypothetical protein
MKYCFIFSLCTLFLFNSCKKSDAAQDPAAGCGTFLSVKATPSLATIAKGEKLTYNASPTFTGGSNRVLSYNWTIPGESGRTTAMDSIVNIDYKHKGWWYVTAKNSCDGTTQKDSFYLTVTIPQGTPSCINVVNNNKISFTDYIIGTETFTNTKMRDSTLDYGGNEIYFGIQSNQPTNPINSAFGTIVIVFHPQFKLNNLPASGIYTTTSIASNGRPIFGTNDFDKCYISYIAYNTTIGMVPYKSNPNQNIYITNQNGKLKAVFCNMVLTGTSSLYNITYSPISTGALVVL